MFPDLTILGSFGSAISKQLLLNKKKTQPNTTKRRVTRTKSNITVVIEEKMSGGRSGS